MALTRCRVVLVRPHYAGNVGAAARAMKNFGLTDLVLVDPVADVNRIDARSLTVRAYGVLDTARVVGTLPEAVADCGFVLAASGETGGLTRKGFWGTPEEKLPALLDALPETPTALVFGPEPHGLTAAEVASCHGSMFIPADPEYPSLNLAQAVAVCLYELRRQWLKRTPAADVSGAEPPAAFADQERAYEHLREALAAVRFLWDFRSDGVFHVLRQMFVRARPTHKEVRLLHGLAKQLLHAADRWGVPHPRDGRPPKLDAGGFAETPPPGPK